MDAGKDAESVRTGDPVDDVRLVMTDAVAKQPERPSSLDAWAAQLPHIDSDVSSDSCDDDSPLDSTPHWNNRPPRMDLPVTNMDDDEDGGGAISLPIPSNPIAGDN